MSLGAELKKIFIKRKGLFILLIAIILNSVLLYRKNDYKNIDSYIENNKSTYDLYMESLYGKCNENKIEYINNLEKTIEIEEEQYNSVIDKLNSGEIDAKKYIELEKKHLKNDENIKIVENLKRIVSYAKNNDNKTYFMYENGWRMFFNNNYSEIFMIIMIIFLLIHKMY